MLRKLCVIVELLMAHRTEKALEKKAQDTETKLSQSDDELLRQMCMLVLRVRFLVPRYENCLLTLESQSMGREY